MNQLFQISNLVRINGHGVCEFSHMLMTKNVTNDVRKNWPIALERRFSGLGLSKESMCRNE